MSQFPAFASASVKAVVAVLLGAASPAASPVPAFSYDPSVNCAIYAAALRDPRFDRYRAPRRVLNHASRRPVFTSPDSPLPTQEMAKRTEPPWNAAGQTYQLLLTGPARPGFLWVSCPWRSLGLYAETISRERGEHIILSLPVLTPDRTHALVYVQRQVMPTYDEGPLWQWDGFVCAAAMEAKAWRTQGCLRHTDAMYIQ